MKKSRLLALTVAAFLFTGCANNATQLRSDTFDASALNSRQEVKLIQILAIQPAKVQVDNSNNQQRSGFWGALAGGLAGAVVGNNSSHSRELATASALGGAVAGASLAGSKELVQGVSITYIESNQALTSVQVGNPCEFAQGLALVTVTDADVTRVQPNAATPCVEGQEQQLSAQSKLSKNDPVVQALLNTKKGSKDKLADLKRDTDILRQENQAQKAMTEGAKEKQRTLTAKERADLELKAGKAIIDAVKDESTLTREISKTVREKGVAPEIKIQR